MISPLKNKIVSILIMLVLLVSLIGCDLTAKMKDDPKQQAVDKSAVNNENNIMDEFNKLTLNGTTSAREMIKFINENIASVNQQHASEMVIALEKQQQLQLPKLQGKYEEDDMVQKKLAKEYQKELTVNFINGLQDKPIKDLLLETKDNGFKLETAEGFYFPIIDYSLYRQYRGNVTPDISAYIEIMAAESEQIPVKDAALMIQWQDILKRAAVQEQFIKQYSSSTKVMDVKQLLKNYLSFALYGTNNTPLFRYEDKQMTPAAKKTYFEFVLNEKDGSFSQIMKEFFILVKNNNYILTKEVEEYRKTAVEGFLKN